LIDILACERMGRGAGGRGKWGYRRLYLEQQQTKKIETEVRDVDRIRIKKVYAGCFQGGLLGGHKSIPVQI
jgi:hypothetical protein